MKVWKHKREELTLEFLLGKIKVTLFLYLQQTNNGIQKMKMNSVYEFFFLIYSAITIFSFKVYILLNSF